LECSSSRRSGLEYPGSKRPVGGRSFSSDINGTALSRALAPEASRPKGLEQDTHDRRTQWSKVRLHPAEQAHYRFFRFIASPRCACISPSTRAFHSAFSQ
jgi:hypothetical protein